MLNSKIKQRIKSLKGNTGLGEKLKKQYYGGSMNTHCNCEITKNNDEQLERILCTLESIDENIESIKDFFIEADSTDTASTPAPIDENKTLDVAFKGDQYFEKFLPNWDKLNETDQETYKKACMGFTVTGVPVFDKENCTILPCENPGCFYPNTDDIVKTPVDILTCPVCGIEYGQPLE